MFVVVLKFCVCARASLIIGKSHRTGLSSESRHRRLSKENVMELHNAKIVPQGHQGTRCIRRLHWGPQDPSWPPTPLSWRARGLLHALGAILERSLLFLGLDAFGALLGPFCGPLGPPGTPLGWSWGALGAVFGDLGIVFGALGLLVFRSKHKNYFFCS